MSKALRSIKLTLRKTLATTLIGLIAYTVATLYNRDFDMIGWSLATVFLVFIMYVSLHLTDFITRIKDLYEELQVGKSMRPTKDMFEYAIKKDLRRDAPHKTEEKLMTDLEKDIEIEKLQSQLDKAKEVIETQNKLLQELATDVNI